MKHLATLLLLIGFTDPAGSKIWVERANVYTVSTQGGCHSNAKTKIGTGNGTFVCVQEDPEEVVRRLDAK